MTRVVSDGLKGMTIMMMLRDVSTGGVDVNRETVDSSVYSRFSTYLTGRTVRDSRKITGRAIKLFFTGKY